MSRGSSTVLQRPDCRPNKLTSSKKTNTLFSSTAVPKTGLLAEFARKELAPSEKPCARSAQPRRHFRPYVRPLGGLPDQLVDAAGLDLEIHRLYVQEAATIRVYWCPSGHPVEHMHPALSVLTPQRIATEAFTDATAAVARLDEIYERNTRFLRDRFEAYANGETTTRAVRATYPFVRITTSTHARLDSRLSYGFVAGPGVHETTVTRPDLFRAYLTEQIRLLIENHGVPVEIGELSEPIPIHFAYRRDINVEAVLPAAESSSVDRPLRDVFDTPDLAAMDDAIANGTLQRLPAHRSRLLCSVPRASTIRCTGFTTTPAPIRSTSRIS